MTALARFSNGYSFVGNCIDKFNSLKVSVLDCVGNSKKKIFTVANSIIGRTLIGSAVENMGECAGLYLGSEYLSSITARNSMPSFILSLN